MANIGGRHYKIDKAPGLVKGPCQLGKYYDKLVKQIQCQFSDNLKYVKIALGYVHSAAGL